MSGCRQVLREGSGPDLESEAGISLKTIGDNRAQIMWSERNSR